jgi:hypothetical protein
MTLTNPFKQIEFERKQHKKTLAVLGEIRSRIAQRNSMGAVSDQFCRLCERPPAGEPYQAYRESCPHHMMDLMIRQQTERLAVPLKIQETPKPPDASLT